MDAKDRLIVGFGSLLDPNKPVFRSAMGTLEIRQLSLCHAAQYEVASLACKPRPLTKPQQRTRLRAGFNVDSSHSLDHARAQVRDISSEARIRICVTPHAPLLGLPEMLP